MHNFVNFILLPLVARLFTNLHVFGKENLPKNAGFIMASNHSGWAEIIYIAYALLPWKIHYMAKKELFRNKLVSRILRNLKAFPIDREKTSVSSIQTSVKILEKGDVVGIFPGGTRNSSTSSLKRGVISIASHANAPIVPVIYSGPPTIKFSHIFTRPSIQIIFGSPIYVTQTYTKHTKHTEHTDPAHKKNYYIDKLNELQNAFSLLSKQLKHK